MFLFINTTESKAEVKIFAERRTFMKRWKNDFTLSQKLLKKLDELFKKDDLDQRKIKAIFVIKGPGRFTSLRVGVAVANALAFSWDVPVVGLMRDEFNEMNYNFLQEKISQLKMKRFEKSVLPMYDRGAVHE